MSKRKNIPKVTETEVLVRSGRRCCLCFGLNSDFTPKKGQIAHLDRDPSNSQLENLAWMCLDHHDEYDTRTSQSKGLTINEVKRYRALLYEAISQARTGGWPVGIEVPCLQCSRPIHATSGISTRGIQFTDKNPNGEDGSPSLYISVYFKTSRLFGSSLPPGNEKWLYFEANMRPSLNFRVQVRAWNDRDVSELMRFLTKDNNKYLPDFLRDADEELATQFAISGYDLHGPSPIVDENLAGDYLRVWREGAENRLMISTFTPTYAGISIHARFGEQVAKDFASYLEEVGFMSPFV
jgi:hypothetical protein